MEFRLQLFAIIYWTLLLTKNKCFCHIHDTPNNEEFAELATQAELPIRNGEELAQRLANFENAKEEIQKMEAAHKTATFKINKFALMSENERNALLSGAAPENIIHQSREKRSALTNTQDTIIPEAFDYRSFGKVTPARDQVGQICGSCWAFAAVGAIESQYLIRFNLSLDLSEQYIVSCEPTWNKCLGGLSTAAFDLAKSKGIPTEACYPYEALNGTCSNKCDNQHKYGVTSHKWEGYDESKYAAALYNHGPLTMSFLTSNAFFYYSSGVLDMPMSECNTGNHAMLLVGYTQDYWIAKNSFGPEWGENGFVRFKRGVNWCNMTREINSVYVAPSPTPPPTNAPNVLTSLEPSTLGCPNYDGGILKMNSTWRNLVLGAFNEQRSQIAKGEIQSSSGAKFPKAKNMRKLIYNCSLEAEIQKSTDSCSLYAQQNWQWFGAWFRNAFSWAIAGSFLQFEVSRFAYKRNITQMTSTSVYTEKFFTVFDSTISIACWYVHKDKCYYNDTSSGLYCGVYPMPNISGPIYEIGLPCSQDSHCTKPGVTYCDATLGLCSPTPITKTTTTTTKNPTTTTTSTTTKKPTTTTKSANLACVDKTNCASYVNLCSNSLYNDLMNQQCARTCNRCPTACADETSDCIGLSYLCNDSLYYSLMTQKCPRTCKRC